MLAFEDVSDEQVGKMKEWAKVHYCKYVKNCGAIGGRLTYHITYTSIGVIVKLVCACGDACDASNYEDW